MEATELRIGNTVLYDRVENTIVGILAEKMNIVNLLTKQGNVITVDICRIQPVSLTEEFAVKHWKMDCFGNFGVNGGCNISFQNKTTNIYQENLEDDIVLNIPEFVHTFQNLIFALTGQELTLK